jgi:hypothetical protein
VCFLCGVRWEWCFTYSSGGSLGSLNLDGFRERQPEGPPARLSIGGGRQGFLADRSSGVTWHRRKGHWRVGATWQRSSHRICWVGRVCGRLDAALRRPPSTSHATSIRISTVLN